MLLQFSIKNFKTFKDKATLSLFASNYDKETREIENIHFDKNFDVRILKSAVIFGANASGKSKFIEALSFMRKFVIKSSKDSQKFEQIAIEPFKLNSESLDQATEFEVIFTFYGVLYRYGFEANNTEIVSEWLYYKPKNKQIELFYREGNKIKTHERNFSKGKAIIKGGLVRENALLVSVASQFNDSISSSVIKWFENLNIISGLKELDFKNNTIQKIKNPNNKKLILEFLKAADLGIVDIQYEEDYFIYSNDLKEKIKEIKESIKGIDPELFSDISTIHNIYDEYKRKIGNAKLSVARDESNGTKKFLYLSGTILDILENGGILIGDELDSNLHPNLVCKIVSLFNSKEFNKKNAQLIFNTHDTNLLSSGLFRRDQIWFTNKTKYGEATLYSLADFKSDEVKKNEPYEENYIKGKYGAIPYLGFFENLENTISHYENEKQKVEQLISRRQHRKQLQKKRSSEPILKRTEATLVEKPYILIVCEGENTEPTYFNQFRLPSATVKIVGEGYNTISLIERAVDFSNDGKYDQIWCVFDKDDFTDANFNKAIEIARKEKFNVAYSNQSFEYWLILHFDDHQGAGMHRKDYNQKINKLLSPFGIVYDGKGDKKINEDFFELLEGIDDLTKKKRIELAIYRAKRNYDLLNHTNPAKEESSTTVFMLVEELLKYI